MNKKTTIATIVIGVAILYMFRKKIATALNSTPFASISDKLFNIISKFEGFYAVAYPDGNGYSVGYGSQFNWDKNRPVQKGDIIDKATAKQWLLNEAQKDYSYVQSLVQIPLTDNQTLALSSFAYNVGKGAFAGSTLLRLLNAGQPINEVANEFDKWTIYKGVPNKGLIARRGAEKQLFLS
jgi:lysozyme